MHLSLLLTELLGSIVLVKYFVNKWGWFKTQEITINSSTESDGRNPIYDKFQEYLAHKFKKHLTSYELVPKRGDVEFSLKDMQGQTFEDKYKEHKISLIIQAGQSILISTDSTKSNKSIVVKSTTATSDDIKAYVQMVMRMKLDSCGMIRVYRPIVKGKKKDEQHIEWESVNVQTTKSLQNTVYSKEVLHDLFDDVQHFMDNEAWYTNRGIPYKKGYLIHGAPGCGKTTIGKILANMYDIPVFCLDLTTVDDNATLIKLMTELNYYVHYQKYILLMEDVERSDFFKDRYDRNTKLTMDCLLNIIDGIVEPHGRIIVMSANDIDPIQRCQALMRPGRIDKSIELKHCNKEQVMKLYNLFYQDYDYAPNWDEWELHENLSPAFVMKLLQENLDKPELFMHLIANATSKDNDTVELDDTFQVAIESAKKDLEATQKRDDGGGRFNGRGRSRRRTRYGSGPQGSDLKSRVKRTQREIINCEKLIASRTARIAKANNRLPDLLEKLKEKTEKEQIEKLKLKAKRRAKWVKSQKEIDSDEEEYETPAFLLNSIARSTVAKGTIVTYAQDEESSESEITTTNLFNDEDSCSDVDNKVEDNVEDNHEPSTNDPIRPKGIPCRLSRSNKKCTSRKDNLLPIATHALIAT